MGDFMDRIPFPVVFIGAILFIVAFGLFLTGCQPLPRAEAKEGDIPIHGGAIQYEMQKTEGPGFSAQILTWTDDSPTGRMIGKRNWYISDKYLYVAVSVDELRVIKDDFFDELVGWPWETAVEKGIVTTVWYDRDIQPFFALRMDYFAKFHKRLETVHKGELPWLVTRTEDDDPKDG